MFSRVVKNSGLSTTATMMVSWTLLMLLCFDLKLISAYYDHNSRYAIDYKPNDSSMTQTQYKLKTIQTGTAIVPFRGAVIRVGPEHNKTKVYLAKYETLLVNTKRTNRRASPKLITSACVKCPSELTAIARRGLDGILVEPPAPVSCATNLPFSRELYEIETLFGPQFMFILPHGKHTLFARIRNTKTGIVEHTCPLKYNVIVRRCQRYRPNDHNLKPMCSAGTVWGSTCTFVCRNGSRLSHQEPIVCGDNLQWMGDEPICFNTNEKEIARLRAPNMLDGCPLPTPPANGKFSCEIDKMANPDATNDYKHTSNGSVCRVHCNRFYAIPMHLKPFAVLKCENGHWNSTLIEFCYRRQPRHQRPLLTHDQQFQQLQHRQSHRLAQIS